ncbi:phosphatase PAP2 family protein [Bacillus sp. HMF5848]|uniref:vanadium-dependent haloperoxidase n=1 Tax=Bacillus sp. HMF5848 TaxID=2495421 RepID=UPI000F7868E8|nr:vanadium-dependent haloperoxidase [Bacillus sp. HMF5848]RSK26439.1 phosphatase PAP2 family protein [Bacillus sp. HMF5848]
MSNYPLWSDLPYAGEKHPPKNGETPYAGSWRTFFIKHGEEGFETLDGHPIQLAIRDPHTIDWYKQLEVVKRTLAKVTEHEKNVAVYWGSGPPTKQWTPIADILIDTYGVEAPRAGRILAALQDGLNDAFVVAWYLKYKWLVARPNQLDPSLATVICTPRHPSYPSGHAVVSGAAEEILAYFFPAERRKLHKLAEENAMSRLYGGVHYPIDNSEGLRLGRQIGRIVVDEIKRDRDSRWKLIDTPYRNYKNAKLIPPPYEQAIPFDFNKKCESLLLEDLRIKNKNKHAPKPKLFY